MNKIFSLLVTCYNASKYLEDCINSVFLQEYRPLEVIFVDDASIDSSYEVVNKFANEFERKGIFLTKVKLDSRVKYGTALYKAYEKAHGSYFGVLDSDDMLENDAIDFVMDVYLRNKKIKYVYTQFDIYDVNMNFKKRGNGKAPSRCMNNKEWKNYLSQLPGRVKEAACAYESPSMAVMGWNYIHTFSHFRTFSDSIKNAGEIFPQGSKTAIDQYMAFKLEEKGIGAFLDKVCYRYRSEVPDSISDIHGADRRGHWHKLCKLALYRRLDNKIKVFPVSII